MDDELSGTLQYLRLTNLAARWDEYLDLAQKEEKEAAFLRGWLPQQLTSEELERLVAEVIAEMGATSIKQMGQVMKVAQAKAQGRADGQALSQVVKSKL